MAQPRPIGMRIPRPYDTEDEFIRGDGLAIGRLGMILIGAPKRPPGITIRFEVLLRNEEPVFRGEGRVVAHRVHGNGREGLEVRFTRLDSRSKKLVEEVLELRRTGALTPLSTTNAPPEVSEDVPQPNRGKPQPPPRPKRSGAPDPTAVDVQSRGHSEPPSSPPAPPAERPAEEILDSSELAPVESQRLGDDSEEVTLESTEEQAQPVDEELEEIEPEEIEPEEIEPEEIEPEEIEPIDEKADDIESIDEETKAVEPVDGEAEVVEARDEEPGEIEPVDEEPEEPLDEDPTPFAPPVMLDELDGQAEEDEPIAEPASEQDEQQPITHSIEHTAEAYPPPPVVVSGDVTSALSKLRERAGAFDPPDSAGTLLERLRERAKAD